MSKKSNHSKKDKKHKKKKHEPEPESDISEDYSVPEEDEEEDVQINDKSREQLKKKINYWLDCDDKIKFFNAKAKKYKDEKKQKEGDILDMLTDLGMDDKKIDVHDNDGELRSRICKYRSVTKGTLKEDIIKEALMEAIRDEKKVDQLVKKIENRRPINERFYLKRTKGNKNE